MLTSATPLFIASAFAQTPLVRWLLANGADRSMGCYLKQTPLDVVGECCAHSVAIPPPAVPGVPRSVVRTAMAECQELLEAPPELPAPPTAGIRFENHTATERVLFKATNALQTVYKCLLGVHWQTPLSNGALIDKYEVRHRLVVLEDDDDNEPNSESGSGSAGSDGGGSMSWRVERVSHSRRTLQQELMLHGLQFDAHYEISLRSWNSAGKGEWSRSYRVSTKPSPETSGGT